MSNLKKQASFQRRFNQPILQQPEKPELARRKLRLELALEELHELAEAMGMEFTFSNMLHKKTKEIDNKDAGDTLEFNSEEVLDALCDIEVINNGSILECGFGLAYAEAYNNVHESNMSKACETMEEAQATVDFYAENEKYDVTKEEVNIEETLDGRYLVKRNDGKVLKSINYKETNMKQFTDERYST